MGKGQRIVISGMGIVSALGIGKMSTLQALQRGESGLAPMRYLQSELSFPVGEVKLTNFEMMDLLHLPIAQRHTRTSLLGMIAMQEALADSAVTHDSGTIAFINGTTVGGMDKTEQYYPDFIANHDKDEYIALHSCGSCSEIIADKFDYLFTQVQTISTACSSAANAIMVGSMLLETGLVDMVVAGGCESITKFHLNGFNSLMILDKQPCKPFDAHRHGLNLGEGAAYIVLETENYFYSRTKIPNVTPLAVFSGYANTCDAFHQTASSADGQGAYLAMMQALEVAKLQPTDIDYINAHGTGTINNDSSESIAIERVFGNEIPVVSSTKGFTGHATSAAGGLEAVISILSLQHTFIPANLNFMTQPEDLPFTPPSVGIKLSHPLQNVLSNSFGFGGNNTSLIFSRYDGKKE